MKRIVLDECTKTLLSLGFKKTKYVFIKQFPSEGVMGWIGLNTASRGPDIFEINLVVAIRHDAVHRLESLLESSTYDKYIPATLGTHIGYVMPENIYLPWLFSPSDDIEKKVCAMKDQIERYGIPFMESLVDLRALLVALELNKYGILQYDVYRIPIVYYLLGEINNAQEALIEQGQRLNARLREPDKRYAEFTERFLAYMEEH